jgi:hypothetical protein
MLKIKYFLIALVLFQILFYGCDQDNNNEYESEVIEISDNEKENILNTDIYSASDDPGGQLTNMSQELPEIPLDKKDYSIFVINENLDLDNKSEQIIAVKNKNDPEGYIRVIIVDFDEIRNMYFSVCEFTTQTVKDTSFEIDIVDLTGDYNLEIVCKGINSNGEITMDILRKTTNPVRLGLYFEPVFQITANLNIQVIKQRRSQSYDSKQTIGKSFPIEVESEDPENPIDIIIDTYYWKYEENTYIKSNTKKISGNEILEERLRELLSLSSTTDDYKLYLKGPWYMASNPNVLLNFDLNENIMSFYENDIIESYYIDDIYRYGHTLTIVSSNIVINQIAVRIKLKINSMDSIQIEIQMDNAVIKDNAKWNGIYMRLTRDLQESLMEVKDPEISLSDLALTGKYTSHENLEIWFHEPPLFSWIDDRGAGRTQKNGGYSILSNVPLLNGFFLQRTMPETIDVITFRFLDSNGLIMSDETYILEYNEKIDENSLTKMILLTDANLTVSGVEVVSNKSLSLYHTEIIENNTGSNADSMENTAIIQPEEN